MKTIITIVRKSTKIGLSLFAIGLSSLPMGCLYGEVVPANRDPSRTLVVGETSTGVEQVHITAPRADGTSYNDVTRFNVNERGVVFSNSCQALYVPEIPEIGVVEGNPHLCDTGPAKTIEVNVIGSSRSDIEGPVYVVGKGADFIFKNPNGIACNGGRFINTPNVVLSTKGSDGKFLEDVIVKEKGLSGEDKITLNGRRIEVKGPITAKEVIRLEGFLQKSKDQDNPIAVDISKIAKVKAGSIYLVATAEGVGVRSLGELEAKAEHIGAAAGGKIELKGKSQAAKVISLTGERVEAEDMNASELYVYTKSYALDATGIRDWVKLEDSDAKDGTGEITLAYAPFASTAQKLEFVGKTFHNEGSLHLKELKIDLKGAPSLNSMLDTKKYSYSGESGIFLYSQFVNMGELLIDEKFELVTTSPALNRGKIDVRDFLNIVGDSFMNWKNWQVKPLATNHNVNELVAKPGSGEIHAGRLEIVTTKGDIFNVAGSVIQTTDPMGKLILSSQGKLENRYYKRANGEMSVEPGFIWYGGFDLLPSIIDAAGDMTLYSETGYFHNYGSIIKMRGNFYSVAQDKFLVDGVKERYCTQYVLDPRGFRDPNHAYKCMAYKDLNLNPPMVIGGETEIISKTSDIQFDGIPVFFGKGGSLEALNGKIIVSPQFVYTDQNPLQIDDASGTMQLQGKALEEYKKWGGIMRQSAIATGASKIAPKAVGGAYIGGTMVWKTGNGIYNSAAILVGPEGNLILNPGENQKIHNLSEAEIYVAVNERGKHWEKYVESATVSPAIMMSLGGNIVFEGEVENTGLLLGKLVFEKDVHNNAKVFETVAYQMKEDKKFLSKTKAEQWVKGGTVIQGTIAGDITFAEGTKYHTKGGILEAKEGTDINLQDGDLFTQVFSYTAAVTTKTTKKGFCSTGATQMIVNAIDGDPASQAVKNIPLIQYWTNAFKTRSSTDFAPPIEAGINTFETIEEFANNYQGSGGDLKTAAWETFKAIGDFTDGGPAGILPKIGWQKETSTIRETFSVLYPAVIKGRKVICNVHDAYLEGTVIVGEESVCINVENDLVMEDAEAEYSRDHHQDVTGVTFGLNSDGFSLNGYRAYSNSHLKRIEHQYNKLEAPSVEIRVGGKLKGGKAIIQAGDAVVEADEIEFTTVQDMARLHEKQRSGSLGVTVNPMGAIPSFSYGEGKGEGNENWAEAQAGVFANNLKVKTNKLTLNGAVLDALAGDVSTEELVTNDVFDEKKYSAESFGISSNTVGQMLLGQSHGTESTIPPVIDSMQQATSILGVVGYGHEEKQEKGINRATVAEGINVHKEDETPHDLSGVNRDPAKAKETLSKDKEVFSIAVPIVDPGKFVDNMQAISATAQDLRNKLVNHFDTVIAQIPEDQPETKEHMEIARDELDKMTKEALDKIPNLPENEKREVISLIAQIASDPNVIKELHYRRAERTVTDDQGNIKESRVDESKFIVERPNRIRTELSDGQVAYMPLDQSFNGEVPWINFETDQSYPEPLPFTEEAKPGMCLAREGAHQFGKHVVIPAREKVQEGIQATIEHFYKQDPKSTQILIEEIILPAAKNIDETFDLACILFEGYARDEFGHEAVDYVKDHYKEGMDGYYAGTTPEERATYEFLGDGAAIFVSGGLKYLKTAKNTVSAVEKAAEGVQAARKLEKGEDYIDLASSEGRIHILDGDGPKDGGGHRHGTGKPGKTEFPQDWSDDKIMHMISDIATDPNAQREAGEFGRTIVYGEREGVKIKVVLENVAKGEEIVTAYPINLPRNPWKK